MKIKFFLYHNRSWLPQIFNFVWKDLFEKKRASTNSHYSFGPF